MAISSRLLLLSCICLFSIASGKHYFEIEFSLTSKEILTCRDNCNISYAISVLTQPDYYSFKVLNLQDGLMQTEGITPRFHSPPVHKHHHHHKHHIKKFHYTHMSENTVVHITDEMKGPNPTYLAIKFLDLPLHMQNYILIDVTSLMTFHETHKKVTFSFGHSVFHAKIVRKKETFDETDYLASPAQCSCQKGKCGCCAFADIPLVSFNHTLCTEATYLAQNHGFLFAIKFDGHEFVHEEISLRNPPPLCIGIPMLKEYADGCIKLYDIRKTEKSLHICAELNISLIHIHIVKENLGCFDIPL